MHMFTPVAGRVLGADQVVEIEQKVLPGEIDPEYWYSSLKKAEFGSR